MSLVTRRRLGRTLFLIFVAAAAWAAIVWHWGGVGTRLGVLRISTHDPLRPLVLAIAALVARLALGGGVRGLWGDIAWCVPRVSPAVFAGLLVVLVVVGGAVGTSITAGGSDSYGYLSQVDLWLAGNLHVPEPVASKLPWPNALVTVTPLGYRPAPDGRSIVPTYPPGFALLMAAFKYVGGQSAMVLVVPLCGGLLVAATFGIGRRLVSPQVGAAASWLVATSPVMLLLLMQPMSDVPTAAFWALATYGCVLRSRRGAFLAGAAAAIAILIRPNLIHLAALIGLWIIWQDRATRPWPRGLVRALVYGAAVSCGCVVLGVFNHDLYGAATTSGYGSLGAYFAVSHLALNLRRYPGWLMQTQTPIALVGLLCLAVPIRWLTKGRMDMPGRGLLALVAAGVVVCYGFYLVFDAWWYVRFLLPCWPAMFVSTAWLLLSPVNRRWRIAGALVVTGMGLYGIRYSYQNELYRFGVGERVNVTIGRLVRDATEPNSLIFTLQNSGTVRYYGERMTLRFDQLDAQWLDKAVAWLHDEGVHPYFLLQDDWERDAFTKRFSTHNTLGDLKMNTVFVYEEGGPLYLYDPLAPGEGVQRDITNKDVIPPPRCAEPGTAPKLVLR